MDENWRQPCRHDVFWMEDFVSRGVAVRIDMRHPDGKHRAMKLIVPDDSLFPVAPGLQTPTHTLRSNRNGDGPDQDDGWVELKVAEETISRLTNLVLKLGRACYDPQEGFDADLNEVESAAVKSMIDQDDFEEASERGEVG